MFTGFCSSPSLQGRNTTAFTQIQTSSFFPPTCVCYEDTKQETAVDQSLQYNNNMMVWILGNFSYLPGQLYFRPVCSKGSGWEAVVINNVTIITNYSSLVHTTLAFERLLKKESFKKFFWKSFRLGCE